MWKLKKTLKLDSSHFLPWHKGKCGNVHGHCWKIIVHCQATKLNKNGILVDFGDIARGLDHVVLNDFIENPTAEIIAKKIFLDTPHCTLVEVWETEDNYVSFDNA